MAIPVQLDADKTLTVADSGLHFYLSTPGRIAAADIFTFNAANIAADSTITIDGVVYVYKAVPSAANEIDIGAASTNSRDNLIAAINKAAGEGTLYGTGTIIHPTVVASAGTGLQLIVTAKIKGTPGNRIPAIENSNGAWATPTLAGGADVVGAGNKELIVLLPPRPVDGTNYKFITEDNGVGVASNGQTYRTNWRINSPIADGFVVRGNVDNVPVVLQTKPTDNSSFTNEALIIGFSGSRQNTEKRYRIGETIELDYFNGKWRGNLFSGSNILGIGDI